LIVIARPDSRRTAVEATLQIAVLEIAAEITLCAFGEHRSPPLPRFAVGCERMAAA
jgi:hypothetical protein